MSEPIRILQVLTTTNRGGAETMVMNCYRALDRSKYQFDFLVHRTGKGDFDDEIKSMGGRIFYAFPIRPWNYLAYFHFLDGFFKKHQREFAAVHGHILENSCFAFKFANKYGIKKLVCTSHAADRSKDYKTIFRKFAMWYGQKYITSKLACGQDAGECLYGNDAKFEIMHNPIDVKRFTYDEIKRLTMRSQRGWEDKLIIGNVARFGYPKNQAFIVDIFNEIKKKRNNSILVFVGEGPDMPAVKEKVSKQGLEECIFFEGLQTDIAKYLNTFDAIVHPSIFEGLPISIIEAQASGVRCFLSDTIDRDTDVTGDVTFLSLQQTPAEWADMILASVPYLRHNNYQKLVDAGYDVRSNIDYLLGLYQ